MAGELVNQCSVCSTDITPHQYSQTKKLFGNPYCGQCIPDQIKKGDDAINAHEPPEMISLRDQGWTFDKGAFTKEIDGRNVLIIYSDLAKRGGACMVAGRPYMPGDNTTIDRELKGLFNKIDEAKGIKPKTEIVRHEPKAPAVVAPANAALSVDSILKYIAPEATEEEAFMFLQLCIARKLNPFLKEAYLIKYSKTAPAAFVVGKDAFMKRADAQPDFKGFKAGLIVKDETGALVRREGTFMQAHETLLGGWAKVIRKDHEKFLEEVALSEYIKTKEGRPSGNWAAMPGTMIRKVALVHALREAYPQEFAGMYDRAEVREVEE